MMRNEEELPMIEPETQLILHGIVLHLSRRRIER
jgi:hypothetical protein